VTPTGSFSAALPAQEWIAILRLNSHDARDAVKVLIERDDLIQLEARHQRSVIRIGNNEIMIDVQVESVSEATVVRKNDTG
jgi:hypothetical protein